MNKSTTEAVATGSTLVALFFSERIPGKPIGHIETTSESVDKE